MNVNRRLFCLLLALALCACAVPVRPEPTEAPSLEQPTLEPTEAPMLSPTAEPTETPTPEPTAEPTPEPTPFALLWLPDTQELSYIGSKTLPALGQEILDRRDEWNVLAVLHSGDITDNGFKEWQWDNFDACLNVFSDALPFYPVAGNHDLGVRELEYDAYLARPFLDRIPEAQKFEGGKLFYAVFGEGAARLLVLGIGWGCGKTADELDWIDALMQTYADVPCVLLTHAFLDEYGRLHVRGKHLYESVVRVYPNVRLVLCGHSQGVSDWSQQCDDDRDGVPERTVTAMMLNPKSGRFRYRVLSFDPVSRSVTVVTYAVGLPEPETVVTLEHAF